MKKLKQILLASVLTVGAFSTTMLTSCNPDPCKDVVCANGGNCDGISGECNCASGYEGSLCDTLSRAKFIATYKVTASCQSTYNSTVTSSSTGDAKVIVSNPAGLDQVNPGTSVIGTCDKTNITVAKQFVTGLSTTEFEGTGTISGNTITMNYIVYVSGSQVANCTSTSWVKQ